MLLAQDASTPVVPGGVGIPALERLKVKDYFTDLARRTVDGEFRAYDIPRERMPAVSVKVEFDEPTYLKDLQDAVTLEESSRRKMLSEMTSPEALAGEKNKSASAQAAAAAQGMRFGRLNIDVSQSDIKALMERPWDPNQKQMALSLQLPLSVVSRDEMSSRMDITRYVKKMEIGLTYSVDVPKALEEAVTNALINEMDLERFNKGEGRETWVKINRVESTLKNPGFSDWLAGMWAPQNNMLVFLALGLLFCVVMLLSAMLLGKVFKSIAASLKELKPAPEASASGGGSSSHEDSDSDHEVVDGETGESGAPTKADNDKILHDQMAISKALTSEMRNIRDQLKVIMTENNQLCTELLRDMFYDAHGLGDFRDLLSFAGYETLKPAMDKLPRVNIEELQTYIEENRSHPTNLLHGVEIASRIYRDCISKITLNEKGAEASDRLRAVLVSAEDHHLKSILTSATSEEVCVLLKCLTVERGNRLMKGLSGDALRDACRLLDKELSEFTTAIELLIVKLQDAAGSAVRKSFAQRRFILRLVRNCSIAEEANISRLVDQDDWEMRHAMMESKFFFMDVVYLPERYIKQALGSFDMAARAEIILNCDDKLKAAMMASYPEGSKQRDMLNSELDSITKNARRTEELKRKKDSVLRDFLSVVRKIITSDPLIIEQVLKNQATALGLKPPGHQDGESMTAPQEPPAPPPEETVEEQAQTSAA